MSFDVVVRRDDTLPVLEKSFYSDGQPINLTGYAVTIQVRNLSGTLLFENPATFVAVDPFNKVRYEFTPADFVILEDTNYAFAQFVAVLGDDRFTVPNNRPLSMLITDTSKHEYSYSGDPSGRPIDTFRFLLQDTNLESAMFTDSEIEYLIGANETVYQAAAEGAMTQAAKYTELRDKTVGPLSIRYGETSERLYSLADSLIKRGNRVGAAGALVISTGQLRYPHVRLGMHDNPQAGHSEIPGQTYPNELLGEV